MGGRNKEGFTALGLAAICGSKEMMETLLHSGCDIKEEPLICIQQDFQPGLMILLDKLAQQGVDGANMSVNEMLPGKRNQFYSLLLHTHCNFFSYFPRYSG